MGPELVRMGLIDRARALVGKHDDKIDERPDPATEYLRRSSRRTIITRLERRMEPSQVAATVKAIQKYLLRRDQKPDLGAEGCVDEFGEDSKVGTNCRIPKRDAEPADVVRFHQRLSVQELARLRKVAIAFVKLDHVDLSFGLLQQYRQTWEYRGTSIGPPVAYISLAPLERRRVQVAYKRRPTFQGLIGPNARRDSHTIRRRLQRPVPVQLTRQSAGTSGLYPHPPLMG